MPILRPLQGYPSWIKQHATTLRHNRNIGTMWQQGIHLIGDPTACIGLVKQKVDILIDILQRGFDISVDEQRVPGFYRDLFGMKGSKAQMLKERLVRWCSYLALLRLN